MAIAQPRLPLFINSVNYDVKRNSEIDLNIVRKAFNLFRKFVKQTSALYIYIVTKKLKQKKVCI